MILGIGAEPWHHEHRSPSWAPARPPGAFKRSLVFFRLIERLAIGAGDDHPQTLLTKALGELHSLSSCIFSAVNVPVTPSTLMARTTYTIPNFPGWLLPGTYQLPLEPSVR
jgi:hypothetical protein